MFSLLLVFSAGYAASLPQTGSRKAKDNLSLGNTCPISKRLFTSGPRCDTGLKCVPNPNNINDKIGICVSETGTSPDAQSNVTETQVLEGGGYSPEVIAAVSSDPFAWITEAGLDTEVISEGEQAFGELLQSTGNSVLSSFLGEGLFGLVKNTKAVTAVRQAFSSLVTKFFGNGPPSQFSLAAKEMLRFFITVSSTKGWKAMNIAAGALNTNALPLLAPVFLQIAVITCGAKSAGNIIGTMFKGSDFDSLSLTVEQAADAITVALQGQIDNSASQNFSLDATLQNLATCMFNRNTQRRIQVAKHIQDSNLVSGFVPGLGDDSALSSAATSTLPEDASISSSPLSPLPTDAISNVVLLYCFGKRDGTPFYDSSLGDGSKKYCPNLDPLDAFPDNQVQKECDICCKNAQHAQDTEFSHDITARLEDRCKENIRSDPNGPNPGFRCKC